MPNNMNSLVAIVGALLVPVLGALQIAPSQNKSTVSSKKALTILIKIV
jgi:hypothetical protein